ncbi:transposase [Metasolibacillus meyeri]|uniref:transposase n=1 Tax=Metasolibacillus meyeri TaxID=1071052 RepID=UPI000D311239|nr:transposase [Metasolibacillus meyeri]
MFFMHSRQDIEKNRQFYQAMYDPNHPLIQLDKLIDWQWIYQKILPYYSPTKTGRPTVDPLFLIKMLVIQGLEGFRSVRFTCKQIQSHATYRWFLGISPFQKVPHHSTVSRFLWERLQGASFWRAFHHTQLLTLQAARFIANETWAADETELKANANKRFRQKLFVQKTIQMKSEELEIINAFRTRHGKKALKPSAPKIDYHPTNFSPIDADARLSVKHVERGQFAYFEHRIVDTLHGFIIATDVTAANVPGHKILPRQVDQLKELFGAYAKEITLDAGYYNATCAKALFDRNFFVSMPYKRPHSKEHPQCRKVQFQQVTETLYCCPNGVPFTYATTTRQGYHELKAPKGSCFHCPFALKEDTDRVLRISIHQPTYDQLREMRLSWRGKILRSVRPQTIELSFAQSKENHGLRYARYRGLQKVETQVLMTAIIQNLKKWAKLRSLQQVGLHLTYKIIEEF